MFFIAKPSLEQITEFLREQSSRPFSYQFVGATSGQIPHGFNIDRNRAYLGNGRDIYLRAIEEIKRWKMFEFDWLELCFTDTPIKKGQNVAVLVNHFSFWSINANRIVYAFDERGKTDKFGFAYGTLLGHAETGEERFMVEYDQTTGDVWYDILAFSLPRHPLAKIGYPLTRILQKRFGKDSIRAMKNAIATT